MAEKFIPLRERGKYNNENNLMDGKPSTEVELFYLQDHWLQYHDKESWLEMQRIIYKYTRSLVLKKLKNKKFLEPNEVDDATTSATLAFMRQYLRPTKDGTPFEVGASFAGMLRYKIMEALYKSHPEDKHQSLDSYIGDSAKTTLGDTLSETNIEGDRFISPEDNVMSETLTETLSQLLQEFDEIVDDGHTRVLARLYLVMYFRKPRSRHAKECFIKNWAMDAKCKQSLDLLIMELHNRMAGAIAA